MSKDSDQWLFLTCMPDQRETLRPLLSCLLDVSVNSLMTLAPDNDRRTWFIIDELAALHKLPSLPMMLAEGRKYGGCVVAGSQSMHQLRDIYGHNSSLGMFELFNTRVFFRSLDPDNANFIARSLGDKEFTEVHENMSYGAHEMRDGVSISTVNRKEFTVAPSELMTLKDLEAIIHLPNSYITKMQMSYKNLKKKVDAFKPLVVEETNQKEKAATEIETDIPSENEDTLIHPAITSLDEDKELTLS
jgi:type IV secretory pathway TraG/TraD family ATPase VirD4